MMYLITAIVSAAILVGISALNSSQIRLNSPPTILNSSPPILNSPTTILNSPPTILNSPKTRNRPSTFCDGKDCVKLPVKRILKFYKDLFFTTAEIQKKLDVWAMNKKEKFGQGGAGPYFDYLCGYSFFQRQQFCKNWKESNQDYDLCCPTQIHHMFNNTLVNSNNVSRFLVKLTNPDRQQFIPEATCLSSGACFAGIGTCRLDTISVWLLVFNISLPPLFCEFDEFEIPAYCSCKTN